MIKIKYSRVSVCMGDDINCGEYILKFKDTSTLKDLIDRIIDCKTDRSLAFTGPSTNWIIESNIGKLAEVTVDEKYNWVIKYNYNESTLLNSLNIEYVKGIR